MVRSLKSSYWPRPVEGQERTGFRPPPLGVVGRWVARVVGGEGGHRLQSNSPEEELHPAPAEPPTQVNPWVTALVGGERAPDENLSQEKGGNWHQKYFF